MYGASMAEKRKRRPKFVQHIPEGPEPMFSLVEHTPGANYWHSKITDAIVGDRPEFRYTPPKKGCPYTVQELANRVAGELNEATGWLTLTEYTDGVPTFASVFASNGRQVTCIASTDAERAEPTDMSAGERWLAGRRQ